MVQVPISWARFKHWRTNIIIFLSVLGPGIITANVDNDAGGIFTYSVAGARYGYSLLWTLIPITIALIVVQEMVARMGMVTGKGLADLIREEYGFRTTFILMVLLLLTNWGIPFQNSRAWHPEWPFSMSAALSPCRWAPSWSGSSWSEARRVL
jgi:Mn2+/Fe2+ NRAMP family transporter